MNHRESKSLLIAQRIYAEFRWELKKHEHTWTQVAALLDTCIRLAEEEIPDETMRHETVAQFRLAKETCLAQQGQEEQASTSKLTGEACVKCGDSFEDGVPKTWIADGEYVCAKCQ